MYRENRPTDSLKLKSEADLLKMKNDILKACCKVLKYKGVLSKINLFFPAMPTEPFLAATTTKSLSLITTFSTLFQP